MAKPLLEIVNLHVQLPTSKGMLCPVNHINFSIAQGETFALVGESGSGKSFTALSILNLLPFNASYSAESKILFKGHDLLKLTEHSLQKIRGRHIGMIFQEPMSALNPVLTVGYQINEVLQKRLGLSKKQSKNKLLELLNQVEMVDAKHCQEAYPHQLSGGQRQRICIAIALAGDPDLLIADEPTTALDVTIQAQILFLLKDIQRKRDMGLLLVTHDLAVVEKIATHVGVMYAGQMMETAPAPTFFENPAHPYSQCLFAALPQRNKVLLDIKGRVPDLTNHVLGCIFADRCPAVLPACSQHHIPDVNINADHIIRCDVPLATRFMPTADNACIKNHIDPTSAIVLTVKNMQVYFEQKKWWQSQKTKPVLNDINFTLRARETLALVGESGSGKTTLAKTLLRFLPLTKGRVELNQADTKNMQHMKRLEQAKWMQMVWQDPYSSLDPRQSIQEILIEALAVSGQLTKINQEKAVKQLLDQVNLPAMSAKRYPHQFSGGQRQRIAIARALAANPRILICDEPTSALDVSVQAQILNLLKELQAERNLAYLIITHNMSVVEYLADTIAVMYRGEIVEYGAAETVLERPQNEYTRLLLESVGVRK